MKERPYFNTYKYMHESEDRIRRYEEEYYKSVYKYVIKRFIIVSVISCIIISAICSFLFYQKGYDDHVYVRNDSPIVYITKTGGKYHTKRCKYLRQSKIEITITEAQKTGYTPCSKCKPDKLLK